MKIMGIKSLYLQMIPLCFHLPSQIPTTTTTITTATNTKSTTQSNNTIRLVASDGQVKIFNHPISASDLMSKYPLHLICRSDSFFIGQKVPALSPHDQLQPGHSYYILPAHFFTHVLSFVMLSSSLITYKKDAVLRSFEIRKTEKGMLQVRMKDDEMTMTNEEMVKKQRRVCTSEELEKEYKELVGIDRLSKWKPRLETIRESNGNCSSKGRKRNVLPSRKKKKKVQF